MFAVFLILCYYIFILILLYAVFSVLKSVHDFSGTIFYSIILEKLLSLASVYYSLKHFIFSM